MWPVPLTSHCQQCLTRAPCHGTNIPRLFRRLFINHTSVIANQNNSAKRLVTSRKARVRSPAGARIFVFTTMSGLTLGFTKASIQMSTCTLFPGVMRLEREDDGSSPLRSSSARCLHGLCGDKIHSHKSAHLS